MDFSKIAPWVTIGITVSLSIIVPLITQIVNNRFLKKSKELELRAKKEDAKISAYENFLKRVGDCLLYGKFDSLSEAGAEISNLYLYAPKEDFEKLDKLADLLQNKHFDNARKIMVEIARDLSADINKHNEVRK